MGWIAGALVASAAINGLSQGFNAKQQRDAQKEQLDLQKKQIAEQKEQMDKQTQKQDDAEANAANASSSLNAPVSLTGGLTSDTLPMERL